MKRRRRGLGSSAAVHRDKTVRLASVVEGEVKNAVDHLQRGACDAALRALGRGKFAAGRAEAHMESAGSQAPHGALFEAKGQLAQAENDIVKRCLR